MVHPLRAIAAVSGLALVCVFASVMPSSAADLPSVEPVAETAAVFDDEAGGNADADDPAIWRNPSDPDHSLVVATAKEGGLRVYDLDAREVQSIAAPEAPGPDAAPGRFNNVDLVDDLAVTSDRGSDRLRIYRIDGDADVPLTDVTDPAAPPIFSASQEEINDQRTAYGLATWTDEESGKSYAVVSQRERTTLSLLELTAGSGGTVSYRKVRTLSLPAEFTLPNGTKWSPCAEPDELPQVEGMVVDTENATLYAAQEAVGLWRMDADLEGTPELVDKVREYGVPGTYDEATEECVAGEDPGFGGERVSADVEGLTLINQEDGDGYLLASSQGDDSFAAYDRELSDENEYEGGFVVSDASETLDSTQESDGAAALNEPLGSKYPDGLLAVQDGDDKPGETDRDATNFKFVDLGDVIDVLED